MYIDVSEPPIVQPFVFPESASIGQRITATCGILQGSKTLLFTWQKDGKDVTGIPNTSVDMQMEYSVLTIVPASKVNVGNYTCIVKNDFGEDRHTAVFLLKGISIFLVKCNISSDSEVLFLSINKLK